MKNYFSSYSKYLFNSFKSIASTTIKEIRNRENSTLKLVSRTLNNFGFVLIAGINDKELREVIPRLFTRNFEWISPFSGKKYKISGFNSPPTIISTFINMDWRWLPVEGKVVIDVGGYIGDTAIYFADRGARTVQVYEAFPYSCKLIENNILQNQLMDKIQIINAAVGSDGGDMVLSPYFENDNESHVEKSHEVGVRVPLKSLKTIIEGINSENSVLKMNCEGCEYNAILEAETGILRTFSHIQMHYHGNLDPLVEKLREAGFSIEIGQFIYARRM